MNQCQLPEESTRLRQWLVPGVAVAVAIYSLCSWLIPPELFNDTAAGYQVWLAMRAGAPFNSFLAPSPANLADSVSVFQPWWAPGQYLVPGALHAIGVPLGRATVLVIALAGVARIFGYWRLWLAWGVGPVIAAECAWVTLLARPFSGYFGNAYVGDALQAAVVPWLALLVWRWRELRIWQCVLLVPVLALAVGVKLSLLVAVIAMLGGVVFAKSRSEDGFRRSALSLGIRAAIVFLAVKWIWDFGYLRRGASIQAGETFNLLNPAAWTQPLAGPLFSALGLQSILNRIFLFPGAPLLTPAGMWPFFLAGALLSLGVLLILVQKFPARCYVSQALAWCLIYAMVFAWFYVSGASVSYEERHYLPAAMVLLPGLVFWLRHTGGRAWRFTGSALLLIACGYGLLSFAVNARHRDRVGATGIHEFNHTTLTRGALAELHRLDADPAGAGTVFYVTMPEISLEVRHGRALVVPADWWPEQMVRSQRFAGRVSRLVLVLPAKFAGNGKLALVQEEFPDYTQWQVHEAGDFLFVTGV
jgi:hypothetical protein